MVDGNLLMARSDPRQAMGELAQRASRYSINLNGWLDEDRTSALGGGSATVQIGKLRPAGIKVTIKTPRSVVHRDVETIERVLNQLDLLCKLDHSNLLPLLGVTIESDLTMSLVYPWMEKGNAQQYVQDKAIDPRPLIKGIAEGLNYLHNQCPDAVFHGNLKGSNVLISDDGRALLTDFGFSLFGSVFSSRSPMRLGGVLNWMAPEILQEGGASAEADIWAFGMTALELFTRQVPFNEFQGPSVIFKILCGSPDRPSDENTCSRMTPSWWNILTSCLKFIAQQRPTITTVVNEIAKIMTGTGFPGTREIPCSTYPRRVLESLVDRASSHCPRINLDERIDINHRQGIRGGYSNVCQGTLRPGGIKVAIKIARNVVPGDEKAVIAVLHEVHVWSKLKHDNVLPLLGITTKFDLTVSIVSQWMEKGNARDHVQNQSVDPRPLIEGIAQGLRYLHNRSAVIIHGDLKGANVLVSENNQALLTDFGLSHLENSSFSMLGSNRAKSGGTMNWMAPEIIDHGEMTTQSDVWSFGMTVLELFTRTRPFHDVLRVELLPIRIVRGPPERPINKDTCFRMTDQWWELCSACWVRPPSLRPTISDISQRIIKIMNSSNTANETSTHAIDTVTKSLDALRVSGPSIDQANMHSPPRAACTITGEVSRTVTIFISEERPLRSPVVLVLTLLPEGHLRAHSALVWRTLTFPAGRAIQHNIDIPTSIGVSTTEADDDGVIYCDMGTAVKRKHMLTFTRTKTWDQQVAECPNTIQVFNNCGILKSFAVYTATPDFGDMPLLYARHIQNNQKVTFGWPVILQAYVCNEHPVGKLLSPNMATSGLFPNDGIDTRTAHRNFQLFTRDDQYILKNVG